MRDAALEVHRVEFELPASITRKPARSNADANPARIASLSSTRRTVAVSCSVSYYLPQAADSRLQPGGQLWEYRFGLRGLSIESDRAVIACYRIFTHPAGLCNAGGVVCSATTERLRCGKPDGLPWVSWPRSY